MVIRNAILRSWEKPNALTLLLWPLSLIYFVLFKLRSYLYAVGLLPSYRAPVPVIVVGNLTVGGTGKTPLVVMLVEQLRARGFNPGVISRGYHSEGSASQALLVTPQSDVAAVGDEAMLMVNRTSVPMAVDANRKNAIETLLANHPVDLIISDDGLQHLALDRDIEICLIDHTNTQENTLLLPAGPYREASSRLQSVDFVVRHGAGQQESYRMRLVAQQPKPLQRNSELTFDPSSPMHVVAGIGNPQRFFDTCTELGFQFDAHIFPDHHHFTSQEISFGDQRQVLMTEKDAVKCHSFAGPEHWYLPVDATISDDLVGDIVAKLDAL